MKRINNVEVLVAYGRREDSIIKCDGSRSLFCS